MANAVLGIAITIGFVILAVIVIRAANKQSKKFEEKEKNIKDKFKGRDLKKYMRAKHGY